MSENIWVLGGYQSDFARNLDPRGPGLRRSRPPRSSTRTLEAASTPDPTIGVVHVGNAFGQLFTGQGQLGAMPATVRPDAVGHAGLAPRGRVRLGQHRACSPPWPTSAPATTTVALVVGVELEKTVTGDDAAGHLGAAAWVGHEGEDAHVHVAAHVLARSPTSTTTATDSTTSTCAPSPQINFANARATPTRRPAAGTSPTSWPDSVATTRRNPIIEGRMRRFDCSQVTDGGAGVVLVTDDLPARPPAVPSPPRWPACSAGATARWASVCSRSSPAIATTPTCCRTCAMP